MTTLETNPWNYLPDHILVNIFSLLNLNDRSLAAKTCKNWSNIFSSPYLWRNFHFRFYEPQDGRFLKLLDSFGISLRSVLIELDQFEKFNRENACKVIEKLTSLSKSAECQLRQLKFKCTGNNPLFYAGQEFVELLIDLFSEIKLENVETKNFSFINIDLSGLPVLYDDTMFYVLAKNHPHLESLNIQNSPLVCKVTSTCILNLVQQCRKLKELCLFNCSMSEDILQAFTEDNRRPLKYLGLICRREEKYTKDLSSNIWKAVVDKLPNLRVSLHFDKTCPLRKVSVIMKQEIPVQELRLETFTHLEIEIKQAARYYCDTLEKVTIQTVSSAGINNAILELSNNCPQLNSLHVFCVLNKETIEKILEQHPTMRESKRYTLKDFPEPHPWATDEHVNQ